MDRHRFDADPDPDPTFHFDADPDPDTDMDWHQNKTKQYLKFYTRQKIRQILLLIFTVMPPVYNVFLLPSVVNVS